MTEREGKEDDRGGTAEVRFIIFIFTVISSSIARVLTLLFVVSQTRTNIIVCPRRCFLCVI